MDERTRRIGENEVLFRRVNEEVDELNRNLAQLTDKTIHIVCECGNIDCAERLVVPLATYERVRAESPLFFVIPGHELLSTEDVVEKTPPFYVVRKHPGGPAELAEATDPRR